MKKSVTALILVSSLLLSGCNLITLESNPGTTATEVTENSEETTVTSLPAETTAKATEETTVTESSVIPEETTPVETTVAQEPVTSGKVVILATGGTIAGVGEAGKSAGYKPGTLTAEDLISAVPELADVAPIEAIQVCNVNSDDITDAI